MENRINIFSYQDYRKLLADLIENRKHQNKPFSYRWFSQRAGFTSPNILNLVVRGKRHLSTESAEKVVEIFKLKKDEGQFFITLVKFEKAKSLSEKEYFAKELIRFKKYQNQFPLSADKLEYYSNWYNIPIRELFSLKDPPKKSTEISNLLTPSVSQNEVEQALKTLLKLGMLKLKDNQLTLAETSVTTGKDFAHYGVVGFHKKMMLLGMESLDRFKSSEREISSVSIGLSKEKFNLVKKMIEEFRDQLMLISEEDLSRDQIYQLNFQLFPLSLKKDE